MAIPKTVLAIDPGSAKCGFALVQREGEKLDLLWRKIVMVEDLQGALHEAMEIAPYSMIIVGNGTRSQSTVHMIREEMPSMGILMVEEKDTTMQARERYWEHIQRKGWRKLLPSTLLVPPDPVDDFVALILAERVLMP